MKKETNISNEITQSAEECFALLKKVGHFAKCDGAWETIQIQVAINKETKALKDEISRLNKNIEMLTSDNALAIFHKELNTAHNEITSLGIRISLRNELIKGYFEKHIEDCRRNMKKYKTSTAEYRLSMDIMNRLIDVKHDVLKC